MGANPHVALDGVSAYAGIDIQDAGTTPPAVPELETSGPPWRLEDLFQLLVDVFV